MQNLVSLICPSLQILGKTQIWVISGNPLYRKIAVPVEQDNVKKKKKKKRDDVTSANCGVIPSFRIHDQFGATFCLTKTENRTNKSLTQL